MKIIYLSLFAFFLSFSSCSKSRDSVSPFPGGSEKYTRLVWSDEFEGSGFPDTAKWSYEEAYLRNAELQYYTVRRSENISVKGGCLTIRALNDSAFIDGAVRPVSSASIFTQNKGDWQYGRIEVRAQLPSCLGTWPAIWMMPTKQKYGEWPDSGEIDIMEHVGYNPDTVYFNLHTKKYNHTKNTGRGSSVYCSDAHTTFHVYAVEWFEDKIDWYMDDKKVFTIQNNEPGFEAWPLDHSFYLIINFAFGGGWGGLKGVDLNKLPQEYTIDYVRVFQ